MECKNVWADKGDTETTQYQQIQVFLLRYNSTMLELMSLVFLTCQLWIVDFHVKSSSNNLSDEIINTSFPNKCHFKNSVYVFITEIIWLTFDTIIDDP